MSDLHEAKLNKQATQGDATSEQPSSFDFVRRGEVRRLVGGGGTTAEESMRPYIELVASLRGNQPSR